MKCQVCCATAGDSNGADEVLPNQVESKKSGTVEPPDVAVANDEPALDAPPNEDPPNEGAASPSDLVPDAATESSAAEESSPAPEENTPAESDSNGV